MATVIGEAAGKVWRYLHANGEASSARIARDNGLSRADVERAIGWLAREGKIQIEKSRRLESVRLS